MKKAIILLAIISIFIFYSNLLHAGKIKGVVIDRLTGKPVKGAVVIAITDIDIEEYLKYSKSTSSTNNNGSFTIKDVSPLYVYKIIAFHDDYFSSNFSVLYSQPPVGNKTRLLYSGLELLKKERIRGQVIEYFSRSPVENANIVVSSKFSNKVIQKKGLRNTDEYIFHTDNNGFFELPPLHPDGKHTITVYKSNYNKIKINYSSFDEDGIIEKPFLINRFPSSPGVYLLTKGNEIIPINKTDPDQVILNKFYDRYGNKLEYRFISLSNLTSLQQIDIDKISEIVLVVNKDSPHRFVSTYAFYNKRLVNKYIGGRQNKEKTPVYIPGNDFLLLNSRKPTSPFGLSYSAIYGEEFTAIDTPYRMIIFDFDKNFGNLFKKNKKSIFANGACVIFSDKLGAYFFKVFTGSSDFNLALSQNKRKASASKFHNIETGKKGGADVSVKAELSSTQFPKDQTAKLLITISGTGSSTKPEIPEVDGLRFIYRGQNSQVQWKKGEKFTTLSYFYMVKAEKTGTRTIEPVKVTVDGKVHTTKALTCTVLPASASQISSAARGSIQQQQSNAPSDRLRSDEGDEIGFMRIFSARDTIYSGQRVSFTVKVYFRKGVRVTLKPGPLFVSEDFSLESIDDQPQQSEEVINNLQYTSLTWQGTLSAIRVGVFPLIMEMDAELLVPDDRQRSNSNDLFFDDPFFKQYSRREIKMVSQEQSITVMDRLTANPPDDFAREIRYGVVNEKTDVMSKASTFADTVKSIAAGTKVEILETKKDFLKIRLGDTEGYIYTDFVNLQNSSWKRSEQLRSRKAMTDVRRTQKDAEQAAARARQELASVIRETGIAPTSGALSGQKADSVVLKQYLSSLYEKVLSFWVLPKSHTWDRSLEAVVVLTVRRDGSIVEMQFDKKSKDPFFDQFVMKTLQSAAPMPRFPAQMSKETIEVGLRFRPSELAI